MLYVVRGLYRLPQRYKGRERSRQRTEVRPENMFGVCAAPFVCLVLLHFAPVSKCLFWYAVNRQISLWVGSGRWECQGIATHKYFLSLCRGALSWNPPQCSYPLYHLVGFLTNCSVIISPLMHASKGILNLTPSSLHLCSPLQQNR